jgi:hypothetical protein
MCSGALFLDLLAKDVATKTPAVHAWEDWDVEAKCPRDASPMQKVAVGSVTIDHCVRCGAVWLDDEEIEHFSRTPAVKRLESQNGGLSEADWLSPLVNAAVDSLISG